MKLDDMVVSPEFAPFTDIEPTIEPLIETKHASVQKLVYPTKTFVMKVYENVQHGSDLYRLERHPDILSRHEERVLRQLQHTKSSKGCIVPKLYAIVPEMPAIIMEYIEGKDDIALLEEGAGQDLIVQRLKELGTLERALYKGKGNAMSIDRLYNDIKVLRDHVGSDKTNEPDLDSVQWNYSFQHGDVRLQHHIENDERSVWIDFEQAGRYPVGYSFVTYTAANNALSRLPYDVFNEVIHYTLSKRHKRHERSGIYSLIAPQELALCASTLQYPAHVQQAYLKGQSVDSMLEERLGYAHGMLDKSLTQGNLTQHHRRFQREMLKIVEELRKNL